MRTCKKNIISLQGAWVLFLLCFSFTAPAQTTEQLDADEGFQGLQLMEDMDTISDFISIFNDPDLLNSKYEYAMLNSQFSYTGSKYQSFAGVPVKKVFLTASGVYITEIKIVLAHDSAVYRALDSLYGKPTVPFKVDPESENKKAYWSFCIWQGKNVRLVVTAKKYKSPKDAEKSEVPEYIYLKYTSLEAERFSRGQQY